VGIPLFKITAGIQNVEMLIFKEKFPFFYYDKTLIERGGNSPRKLAKCILNCDLH